MDKLIAKAKSPNIYVTILVIGLLTAVSGELKITPFDEVSLRFGFGSIVFFIAILIRPVPIVTTGAITGFIVWLFRTIIDTWQMGSLQFVENVPAALFYIVFALGLAALNLEKWRFYPFYLGLIGAALEFVANAMELILHIFLLDEMLLDAKEYSSLLFVAMIRSFFVVGLYSAIVVQEQKKRTEQLLSIHSTLSVEALYVEKMMQNIEQITKDSFQLYQKLNGHDSNIEALQIAQNIHEVKKDAERLNAGLKKLVQQENNERYDVVELLHFVVEANKQYAIAAGKEISIYAHWNENFSVRQHYLILAVLNNIVANAIEAIPQSGTVLIYIQKNVDHVQMIIQNSGPKIEADFLEVIFDPGFTTKFHVDGSASTGIGLSHVKAIVEQLGGTISVGNGAMTEFHLMLPIDKL